MSLSNREIEHALQIAARIVHRYGDVYWPLFERLERELADRRSRSSRLNTYLTNRPSLVIEAQTARPEKGERSSRVRPV